VHQFLQGNSHASRIHEEVAKQLFISGGMANSSGGASAGHPPGGAVRAQFGGDDGALPSSQPPPSASFGVQPPASSSTNDHPGGATSATRSVPTRATPQWMRRAQSTFTRTPTRIVAQLELRAVASRAHRAGAAAAPDFTSPSHGQKLGFQKWFRDKSHYEVALRRMHQHRNVEPRVWRGTSTKTCHISFCQHTQTVLQKAARVSIVCRATRPRYFKAGRARASTSRRCWQHLRRRGGVLTAARNQSQ
jgi:hypothetical protein